MNQHIRRPLGKSELSVTPLALGGNVFGWTAGESESFGVLDAYVGAGGNFIDTADSYSSWAPGNVGGESETIIGSWLKSRGSRDELVIASKVSQHPEFAGLSPTTVAAAADASLERLGVDVIDLYYAHYDDPSTPLEATIEAFSKLVDTGKVRYIGVSNYSPERLSEWLAVTEAGSYHAPVALQPLYNLVERGIEKTLVPIARDAGIGVIPYYSLAHGFLTGKYRAGKSHGQSPRADAATSYLDERGERVLAVLDATAAAHDVSVAAVALAWLAAQPTVVAPIASARTIDQLPDLLEHVSLELTPVEIAALSSASV